MVKSYSFFLLLVSVLMASCKGWVSSYAMVNESREGIEAIWSSMENPENRWHPYFKKADYNDTLLIILEGDIQPMEIMYVFKNDTCFYQQMNLYCSPCAERVVKKILKDRRYRFKEVDGVNYISKTQKGVILRQGSSLKDDRMCSDIKIIRLEEE